MKQENDQSIRQAESEGLHKDIGWIIADGHVHVHRCFDSEIFLFQARENFLNIVKKYSLKGKITAFLLLTESAGCNFFLDLKKKSGSLSRMDVQPTADPNTLFIPHQDELSLYIVAGRQIVTAESLEVLALGMNHSFPDGLPVRDVLARIDEEDLIPVIPWGAGKWLGRRGRAVRSLIMSFPQRHFFLGDNGNRPFFWPKGQLFNLAAQRGIGNLPGSDPLPFAHQERKAGNFGFFVPGFINPERPFSNFKKALYSKMNRMNEYGDSEKILPFFRHQITMQCERLL